MGVDLRRGLERGWELESGLAWGLHVHTETKLVALLDKAAYELPSGVVRVSDFVEFMQR